MNRGRSVTDDNAIIHQSVGFIDAPPDEPKLRFNKIIIPGWEISTFKLFMMADTEISNTFVSSVLIGLYRCMAPLSFKNNRFTSQFIQINILIESTTNFSQFETKSILGFTCGVLTGVICSGFVCQYRQKTPQM